MPQRYNTRLLLLAIVLFGFALRLYRLDALPFRGDEGFTVQNWVMQPLDDAIFNLQDEGLYPLIVIDPHPALAYTLYNIWGRFVGLSELAIRMLPTLANTIGIAAIYALGCRLWNKKAGLLAALLWAIHPFEIWHAQDARNYGIWPAMSVTAIWLALRALTINRARDWVLYTLAALIAVYTYYLELFVIATLNVYVFITYIRHRRILQRWITSQVIVGGLFLIWLIYFLGVLRQSEMYSGTAGGFSLDTLLTWFLPSLAFGQTLSEDIMRWLGVAVLIALILCATYVASKNRRVAMLLVLLIGVPVIAISVVSSQLPVYAPRYILGTVPAILLLVSITSVSLLSARSTRWIGAILLGGWLLISAVSLNDHYHNADHYKVRDWPDVAQYLADMTQPDDIIIQTTTDAGFGYYYRQTGNDTPEFGLPINKEQPTEEIEAILEDGLDQFDRYWVVAQTNPDWPNRHVIEDWLNSHMQQALVASPGDISVQLYAPWDVEANDLPENSIARFADVANVLDVVIFPRDENESITVWVYWEPVTTTEAPLKGFVHLVGDTNPATGGPLWSQDDHEPQHGRAATTFWEVGEIYRDVYTINVADVPSGNYDLLLGLYEPESNNRIPLADGTDTLNLGSITLP